MDRAMLISSLSKIDEKKVKNKTLIEYLEFKKSNFDCIILFQIGDFFETFFEDAKIFSLVGTVALSNRNFQGAGKVLQAGIPKKSLEIYVKKLLKANYKVCVCTQYKDENDETYREITRKYTNGTIIEDDFLDSGENNHILALYYENEICYLAYADVSTGQFYKSKGKIEALTFELEKISPCEILISDKQQEIFKKYLGNYHITVFDDKNFSGDLIENSILDYCLETQKKYTAKLDKVIEYRMTSFMQMDEITRRNLELTRTKRMLKKKGSIFWFLNSTKTPMGLRLLKKYIDEPLLDIKEIQNRQAAVEELIEKSKILADLECTMNNFCDLSRLCAKISNSTISAKNLLQISQNAVFLYDIDDICKNLNSELLKINTKNLAKTQEFLSEINSALMDEPATELKSGGIIKDGYNASLDYLRSKLAAEEGKLETYAKREAARMKIDKLRLGKSPSIGYYIEIPHIKINLLSKDYLRKQSLSNCSRFANDVIKKYEQEIYNLTFQINQLEYELFCELRKKAALFVDIIRDLAKDAAKIDVLSAFARCAIENNLVKPEFNKNGIYINDGFHPSLIKLGNEVVKNDTMLDNHCAIILTGANMSGKSTYLKHNAVICLFSQIGAYVPARSAKVTVIDKIFFRQGITDDIVNNNSSFMVEMNDLKFVIDNSTDKSLVLLDEPAKSTNEKEGGAIARAFIEYMVDKNKPKAIIVTHNCELTNIEAQYKPRVLNYVMETFSNTDGAVYLRKMKKGIMNSSYAIETAILADLPAEIINRAKAILEGCNP